MKINLLVQVVFFIPLFALTCNILLLNLKSIKFRNSSVVYKFSNGVVLWVISITLIFITGFRSRDGLSFDYVNYESIYLSYKSLSWKETLFQGGGEILFSLLYKFCGEISNYNIVFFMFIVAVLTIIPIVVFIKKKSEIPWLSLFLLVTIGSFWTSFNTTRQYLAASLYILSYKYIKNKQFLKYFFIVVFISLIHTSTILMIPFYWLLNINWDFRKKALKSFLWVLFIIFGIVSVTKIIKYIVPQYLLTVELMQDHSSPIQLIRPLALFVPLLLNFRRLDINKKDDLFFFNCTFFYLIIFSMTLSFKVFQRWSYFLIFPVIVAVPNIISRIPSKDERLFYYIFFLAFSLSYSWVTLSTETYTFFWS